MEPILTSKPDPDSRLLVGYIGKCHGIIGEVTLTLVTDDAFRLETLETVFIGDSPDRAKPVRVKSFRLHRTKRGVSALMRFEGVDSRESARALLTHQVFARLADLPPLADDEYFLDDLAGLSVFTEGGERIGIVKEILQMPAHEVLRVMRDGAEDALIPAVPAFIREVNVAQGRLVIELIEGLLD